MSEMLERLQASFSNLLQQGIDLVPTIVTAIVMLVIALIFCKIVERVLRAILTRIRFDGLVQKAGIDQALSKLGLRKDLNTFLPRLVYFLLLFLIARVMADTLGLVAISDAIGAFFTYLPNLIAALLLIVLGSAASQAAAAMITEAGRESGLDFAPALGRIVGALILFIVGMMALGQLKIDTDIIRIVTALFLAGVALAFGLSIGVGSREVTRNILAGYYAKKILEVGKPIEIAGERGILRGITATHVLVEQDGKIVTVANDTLLTQVGKQ